ncbi:hypothetical protein GCM10020227_39710 [Streptomyces flavovirens]
MAGKLPARAEWRVPGRRAPVRRAAPRARLRGRSGPPRGPGGVLLVCGRAPGRALWPGQDASASLVLRGSARCTGLSGLGETAAPIPAGGEPAREVTHTSRAVP